jgi:hypothetical protein
MSKLKMNKWSLLIIITFLLFSCQRKKEAPNFVTAVKETGQLVTAEYTLSKIIKANDNKTWYKVGDRKLLMSCEAYLKAGIDLRSITEENIVQNDSLVTLTLPPAAIFSLNIPADKIQVQYQHIDWTRDAFSAAEREDLLAQAQVQMQQLADSLGILKTAEENGALFLQKLLQATTTKKVVIRFQQ